MFYKTFLKNKRKKKNGNASSFFFFEYYLDYAYGRLKLSMNQTF